MALLTITLPSVNIPLMGETLASPNNQAERNAAFKAVQALDTIAAGYRGRGVDLNKKPADPVRGAHDNLTIAHDVAIATSAYHALTGSRLVIAEVFPVPNISIFPGKEDAGQVAITTQRKVIPLTDQRIDKIMKRQKKVPNRALLITRFGRTSPARFFDLARKDVSRSLKKRPWLLFPVTR